MLEGVIRNHPLVGIGVRGEERASTRRGAAGGLRFALYGREAIVEPSTRSCSETLAAIPGVTVGGATFRGDESARAAHDARRQGPGRRAGHRADRRSTRSRSATTPATSTSPRRAAVGRRGRSSRSAAARALRAARAAACSARSSCCRAALLHISPLIFDTKRRGARPAPPTTPTRRWSSSSRGLGYPVYRTNIQHMDLVADQFDWGDHALRRFNERLKERSTQTASSRPASRASGRRGCAAR